MCYIVALIFYGETALLGDILGYALASHALDIYSMLFARRQLVAMRPIATVNVETFHRLHRLTRPLKQETVNR